jgi:hypothetical protein
MEGEGDAARRVAQEGEHALDERDVVTAAVAARAVGQAPTRGS